MPINLLLLYNKLCFNMSDRPAIPTEIRRRIFMEAGYRCAIPTCRFPIPDNHHIFSWADSRDQSYENLIALCPNCHEMFHKGRIPLEAIRAYKKKLIFLNDVYSRFELDVLDHLKSHKRAVIPGELLIKRLLDEGIVSREDDISSVSFDDGEDILGIFSVMLTDKGRRLIEDWFKIDDSLTYEKV